jgi:N-methylhydantoinase B
MTYRFLEPGMIAIHDDRWFISPWGVNGGEPGARARKILEKGDGTRTIIGNKVEEIGVEADDQLHFITWGGGGWGDPLARDPEIVAREVREGLVSEEGARRYGVVLTSAGVDVDATARLREQLRADSGDADEIFSFGPPIEELRARCQAETGLAPPRRPLWRPATEAA